MDLIDKTSQFEKLQQQQQLKVNVGDTLKKFGRKNYGNNILLCCDQNGQPKYMLGPHYYIFIISLVICASLLVLLLISMKSVVSQVWLGILSCSSLLFLFSYLNIGLSLPGIASSAQQPIEQIKQSQNYCIRCKIQKKRSVYHCEDCDVCIAGHDHHCPWIGKCVGKDNLLSFYFFIMLTFGNLILCFIATILSGSNSQTNNLTTKILT